MNLERHQIIFRKVKGLAVVLIVSTSMARTAKAQIIPPLAEDLIGENGDEISIFFFGLWRGSRKIYVLCSIEVQTCYS